MTEITAVASASNRSAPNRLTCPLAYLKGKDAESEEAQEHANSSILGTVRLRVRAISGEISGQTSQDPPFSFFGCWFPSCPSFSK